MVSLRPVNLLVFVSTKRRASLFFLWLILAEFCSVCLPLQTQRSSGIHYPRHCLGYEDLAEGSHCTKEAPLAWEVASMKTRGTWSNRMMHHIVQRRRPKKLGGTWTSTFRTAESCMFEYPYLRQKSVHSEQEGYWKRAHCIRGKNTKQKLKLKRR